MIAKALVVVSALFLLSGCGAVTALEVISKEIGREPLNIDHPKPITLKPIQWVAITEENYKEVFGQLKAQGYDPVLFGLTDEGYEDMSLNFAEIRNFIILQRKILQKYKDYYEGNDQGSEE